MNNDNTQSDREKKELETANDESMNTTEENTSSGNIDSSSSSYDSNSETNASNSDTNGVANTTDNTVGNKTEESIAAGGNFPASNNFNGQAEAKKGGSLFWMISTFVLAAALVIVLIKPPFGLKNETVAKVNSSTITKEQLYQAMVKVAGPSFLNNLIDEELLQQEMKAQGITLGDKDITDEIDAIKLSYGGEEQLMSLLDANGMTIDMLRENVRPSVISRKLQEKKTSVDDEAIKNFFDENKDSIGGSEQIRASHILVETKEEAEEILAKLKEGADFAEFAAEKNPDSTAQTGGDLGFFSKGKMVPAFADAAFALEKDQLSDVVQTDFGFHIIKKTDEKAGATLEDLKDAIRAMLISEELASTGNTTLESLHNNATIKNYLEPKKDTDPSEKPEETPTEKAE